MEKFYNEKHLPPLHYRERQKPYRPVKKITWNENDEISYTTSENKIIFVLEGEFTISLDHNVSNHYINPGQMFFLPSGSHTYIITYKPVKSIILQVSNAAGICEEFSLKDMPEVKKGAANKITPLIIHPRLKQYLTLFIADIKNGLRTESYLDLKIKELFYIYINYYRREELVNFFSPILSQNQRFYDFIIKNYKAVKTVKEFASLSTYSLSGFEKEFKKVFGMPAYQWMLNKKVKHLFEELTTTTKPLKIISDECRFSSVTQLNDFCKKHFGVSPGKLRENHKK